MGYATAKWRMPWTGATRQVVVVMMTGWAMGASTAAVAAGPPAPTDPPETAAEKTADTAIETDSRPVVESEIEVVGDRPQLPTIDLVDLHDRSPQGDGGEALSGAQGVSGGRMDGHGFEPVIRGLGASSLNVRLDGAAIHGGCPNRMDPQTSFAAPEGYDEVVLIRGVQSLEYGPGGSAGTVLFERHAPDLSADRGWRATLGAAIGTLLDGPTASLDFAFGGDQTWLRLLASRTAQEDYQDGSGRTVRSAFTSRSTAVVGSWQLTLDSRLELSVDATRTDDALFAGAGMDAPEDAADTVRVGFETRFGSASNIALRAQVYGSRVDHLMDNYSLRPLTAAMAMRVPASSDSVGGRLRFERASESGWRFVGGLDADRNRRQATRYAGPSPAATTTVQSVMWPDVTVDAVGGFIESGRSVGRHSRLRLGVRLDHFSADAADADRPTMGGGGPTPRQLWAATYGTAGSVWDDTAVGGLVRWEWRSHDLDVFVGASRSVRPPDATERFLAANSPNPQLRWIGNPGLAAPRHHQLDLGLVWHGTAGRLAVTGFADAVNDFVLRDRARGQDGVVIADLGSIYRNVDARRLGAELEATSDLGGGVSLIAVASWVRADNRTDHRPIAQTPPLEGSMGASWSGRRLSGAATFRWAARQNRVDDDPLTGSGLDAGRTPGWTALDLSAGMEIGWGVSARVGIDNLLDATYARHLSRGNLFDPTPLQVHEPGRTTWLRVTWRSEGRRR